MPRSYAHTTTPAEERDEMRTPPYVFEYANRRWGPFDVDLAATAENALCPQYITKEEDAFSVDWLEYGSCGWCNPPYSNITPWLEEASIAGGGTRWTTVLLIPTPNGDLRDMWLDEADQIVLIAGRLSFLRPDGTPLRGNTRGSCFVVFGSGYDGDLFEVVERREMKRCP